MLSWLSVIPGLFGTINGITNAISNERIKTIQAKTDQERIAAEERLETLRARRDVMIAESGSRWNLLIRTSIGAWVSFFLGKVLVWDKALGTWTKGHTDLLDPDLWQVIMATVGFYFLYEGGVKIAKIIKS